MSTIFAPEECLRKPNKSFLMRAYNRARKVANDGRMSKTSLRKAFGLAQNDDRFFAKLAEYGTTDRVCHCDGQHFTGRCYHMYAVWLRLRANQWQDEVDIELANLLVELFDIYEKEYVVEAGC